jgi:hypothetical protein
MPTSTPTRRAPMSRFLATSAFLASLLASGCAAPTQPVSTVLPVTDHAVASTTRMDRADIRGAAITGDLLRLDVEYGGGCAEHRFALLFEHVFLESLPPQAVLRLAHDARGDPCRALLQRELVFDLAPVRRAYERNYGPRGPLDLRIVAAGGGDAPAELLRYTF